MSGHVAPHRWADAWAGRVEEDERAAMDRHAERCPACARVRARVTRASDSFASIRAQSVPELSWDSVRARVHWSMSDERRARRARRRARRRPLHGWLAFGGAAAAVAAAALALGPIAMPPRAADAPAASGLIAGAPPAARPAPLIGLATRATGDVLVDGIRPDDLFARRIAAGTVIATGDGRVDVQFGEASGFGLAPRSQLELRRFDAAAIELVVVGTVDIQVSPRAAGQQLIVRAGARTVEVRGTQFRVRHDDGATTVACRHGSVVVGDDHGRIELGAARRLDVGAAHPVGAAPVTPLGADELAELADATPMTLPLWDVEALIHSSAPLDIATAGRRPVRVDGVELGLAPMRVRVMPGRHTVEAADSVGRFRRAGWVDVAAPSAATRPARLEIPAEPPPTRGITERRAQLRAGIDRARLRQCTRQFAKQGLTGTYVQIELAVDARGAVGFLNVIESDLPSSSARCVRDVLADVRFGPGAGATWRERIDL